MHIFVINCLMMEKFNLQSGKILSRVLFPDAYQVTDKQNSLESSTSHDAYAKVSEVLAAEYASSEVRFPKIFNDDKNYYKLVLATRKGLPYKSLKNAQTLMPFSSQEWADMLHISSRSLVRLRNEKKRLSRTQTEKLIEVSLLFDYGVDVFGSSEKFSKWLNRTNVALGGIEPKSLLDTNQGIKAVEVALSRIEHGVLA